MSCGHRFSSPDMKLTAPLLVALSVALAAPAAAAPAAKPDRSGAAKSKTVSSFTSPLVFYIAKGETDACGQGCSEWIAAEGYFDLGAAQRLRTFLTHFGGRKLPIFFQSPGGIGTAAMA